MKKVKNNVYFRFYFVIAFVATHFSLSFLYVIRLQFAHLPVVVSAVVNCLDKKNIFGHHIMTWWTIEHFLVQYAVYKRIKFKNIQFIFYSEFNFFSINIPSILLNITWKWHEHRRMTTQVVWHGDSTRSRSLKNNWILNIFGKKQMNNICSNLIRVHTRFSN